MIQLTGSQVTPAFVGAIDQAGYEWLWVSDLPLIPGGATVKRRHTDTGAESLIDYGPADIIWLRSPMTDAVADAILSAARAAAARREAAWRDQYEAALTDPTRDDGDVNT